MMHDFQSQRQVVNPFGNATTVWVCSRCQMEIWAVDRPKRMKPRDMGTGKRITCDELILDRVQNS